MPQKQVEHDAEDLLLEDDALDEWTGELNGQSRSEDSEAQYKGPGESTMEEDGDEEEDEADEDSSP